MPSDYERALDAPKSQFGIARTSLWNVSFLHGKSFWFVKYGLVPADLPERIAPETLLNLRDEVNAAPGISKSERLSREEVRGLLRDFEAAVIHWVADADSNGSPAVSDRLSVILLGLSAAIENVHHLDREELAALGQFFSLTNPRLHSLRHVTDRFDALAFSAIAMKKRRGRKRAGGARLNCLVDGLIDDWHRWTRRPCNYSTDTGSAHHFLFSAINLLLEFPPDRNAHPLLALLEDQTATLKRVIDAPLRSALRAAAERNASQNGGVIP